MRDWAELELDISTGYDELDSWKVVELDFRNIDRQIPIVFRIGEKETAREMLHTLPEEDENLVTPYLRILDEKSDMFEFQSSRTHR
jgi:hypothetical protein